MHRSKILKYPFCSFEYTLSLIHIYYYGIKREEIVAVGDGENDKNMLLYAGLGVAMQDAMENVKSCADKVTLSNNKSGVAFAIETFM